MGVIPPPNVGPPGKDMGPTAKKRARKGSRVDENDHDSYLDSVMSQLKNLPPVATMEPRLHHFYNACPAYGCGDMPKNLAQDINLLTGTLEGGYCNASLSNEGDYYSTMPFGPEPPVPNIKTVTINPKRFYAEEFETPRPDPKPKSSCFDSPSPDLFYSSSPEPDEKSQHDQQNTTNQMVNGGDQVPRKKRKTNKKKPWHDLEPDDSEEDEEETAGGDKNDEKKKEEPSNFTDERPVSPITDLIVPIPIRPKPAPTITLKDIRKATDKENSIEDAVSKAKARSAIMPTPSALAFNKTNKKTTVSMVVNGNSNKSVLRVLNGLSKILELGATPKHWVVEDKNGVARDMFSCKVEAGGGADLPPVETSIDLQAILTSGAKCCKK